MKVVGQARYDDLSLDNVRDVELVGCGTMQMSVKATTNGVDERDRVSE